MSVASKVQRIQRHTESAIDEIKISKYYFRVLGDQIFWWLKDESEKRQENKNAYQGAVVPQGKSCWVQLI